MSPPAIVVPVASGERLGALVQRERLRVRQRGRQHHAEVGLARRDAHRREVGQRGGQRAVADVGRRRLAEPEVRPVDHHVDGRDGERVAADDRGVVADPAHDASRRPGARARAPIASISASSRMSGAGAGRWAGPGC